MLDTNLTDEEFNLHNPAYCGFLIYTIIREHKVQSIDGLDSGLVYISLPIILTKPLSSALPKNSFSSSILAWVNSSNGLLLDFPSRVESYFEITQSAINFLFKHELLKISEDGKLHPIEQKLPKTPSLFNKSTHMKSQLSAAKFLGKWFANSPNTSTIYTVLGIKP